MFKDAKGVPNKRYMLEFKKPIEENVQKEKLSYREAARSFEVNDDKRAAAWERIYLTEGSEGFTIKHQGRSSKGRPPSHLPEKIF